MALVGTKWLRQASDRLVELLFPSRCAICCWEFEERAPGIAVCESCLAALPRITGATCRRCLARVPEIPGPTSDCKHCRDHKLQFDRTLALGKYEGLIRDQVLRMKDEATGATAFVLGRLVGQELRNALLALEPDVIAPIPRHGWRRFSRRADPTQSLALALGRELGVPVEPHLLAWRRDAAAQVGLSQAGRLRNMQGTLQVRRDYRLDAPQVLLVDDIITTGATCSEAARALKRAGAAEVSVVVVGRTTVV